MSYGDTFFASLGSAHQQPLCSLKGGAGLAEQSQTESESDSQPHQHARARARRERQAAALSETSASESEQVSGGKRAAASSSIARHAGASSSSSASLFASRSVKPKVEPKDPNQGLDRLSSIRNVITHYRLTKYRERVVSPDLPGVSSQGSLTHICDAKEAKRLRAKYRAWTITESELWGLAHYDLLQPRCLVYSKRTERSIERSTAVELRLNTPRATPKARRTAPAFSPTSDARSTPTFAVRPPFYAQHSISLSATPMEATRTSVLGSKSAVKSEPRSLPTVKPEPRSLEEQNIILQNISFATSSEESDDEGDFGESNRAERQVAQCIQRAREQQRSKMRNSRVRNNWEDQQVLNEAEREAGRESHKQRHSVANAVYRALRAADGDGATSDSGDSDSVEENDEFCRLCRMTQALPPHDVGTACTICCDNCVHVYHRPCLESFIGINLPAYNKLGRCLARGNRDPFQCFDHQIACATRKQRMKRETSVAHESKTLAQFPPAELPEVESVTAAMQAGEHARFWNHLESKGEEQSPLVLGRRTRHFTRCFLRERKESEAAQLEKLGERGARIAAREALIAQATLDAEAKAAEAREKGRDQLQLFRHSVTGAVAARSATIDVSDDDSLEHRAPQSSLGAHFAAAAAAPASASSSVFAAASSASASSRPQPSFLRSRIEPCKPCCATSHSTLQS